MRLKFASPLAVLVAIFFISQPAITAQVIQVKTNKIMIDAQDDTLAVGQQYYLINSLNKKVAIAEISIVKGDKAIAVVTKGKSSGKETLQLKEAATPESIMAPDESTVSQKTYRYGSRKISVVLNMFNNSMTAKEANGDTPIVVEDVSMKGTSTGLTGIWDIPLQSWFTLRGTTGYEPFKASGTASSLACDQLLSATCTAEMTYLSFGLYARFDFLRGKGFMGWAALGGTSKYPIAKSSTALKTEDLKLTASYAVALGADYFISNKIFIPVSFEQQSIIGSDTVKASFTVIRFGVGVAY